MDDLKVCTCQKIEAYVHRACSIVIQELSMLWESAAVRFRILFSVSTIPSKA